MLKGDTDYVNLKIGPSRSKKLGLFFSLGWGEGLSSTLSIVGVSNMCLITCTSSGKVETPCEGMSQFCHSLQIQEDALPTEDVANSAALSQISPFLPVAWVGVAKI